MILQRAGYRCKMNRVGVEPRKGDILDILGHRIQTSEQLILLVSTWLHPSLGMVSLRFKGDAE